MNTASMSNFFSHSRSKPLNSNQSKINLHFSCGCCNRFHRAVLIISDSKNTLGQNKFHRLMKTGFQRFTDTEN